LWWLAPTTKASEKQGAKKCTKPPQFPKMDCGDKSIRRRNKRAAHEKKTAKNAPFLYRKRHLPVLPRIRHRSARNHTAKQAYKYITKYSKLA
jgi:hypothetical protein